MTGSLQGRADMAVGDGAGHSGDGGVSQNSNPSRSVCHPRQDFRVPFLVAFFFLSRGGLSATQRSYHHADESAELPDMQGRVHKNHHGQLTCKVYHSFDVEYLCHREATGCEEVPYMQRS
jgi:hypothetical protein